MSNTKRGVCLTVLCLLLSLFSMDVVAQQAQTLDKIVAIIGRNRIVLLSDVRAQIQQMKLQDPNAVPDEKTAEEMLLKQIIQQKMAVEQADRDSVTVTDEDVDGQLDNRIRYFTQVYGSKEKLEQVSGKTIYQLKDEYRDVIKEQMLAEKVQGQVLENVKITPKEVEQFYSKISKDSLPDFPATVEVGQIVIDPKVSPEMDELAHATLTELRNRIIAGELSFEAAAGLYSEDGGSRDNGGRYDGVSKKGNWVPEFLAATFKLQNGEISPLVKTTFGYHIIKMINRRGEEADVAHILIKPTVVTADINKAMATLDSLRTLIVTGKYTFSEAVGKFSTDEAAKRTGGMIADPSTGNTDLEISKLDPAMVMLLDTLQQGQISAPHIYYNDQREKSCRIVYVRERTQPHKANLKDDYGKIQEVALAQKKQTKMVNWVAAKAPTFYLWVAPEYRNIEGIKSWIVQ